jgi:uncharacterized protein YbaP (TraB family)
MKILYTLVLSLFWFLSFGQEKVTPEMNNVFWEISKPGSKKVSYLFGTIHLIDKDKYILPNSVISKLSKSDLVVMEIADLDNQTGMLDLITLKEGRMTDILSNSQKDSLYQFTERKFGMDSSSFEAAMGKFKPVFFMQLPYASLVLTSESYDKNINKLAKNEGIPILGLETAEEQIGYFDNLSSELKAKMIMQVIQDTTDFKATWENLQSLYLNQKVSEMSAMNAGGADIMKFYETTLSSDRNKRWLQTITNSMEKSSTFIAVGAGHLPGNDGLVNLLKQEGYLLTPIQIKLK